MRICKICRQEKNDEDFQIQQRRGNKIYRCSSCKLCDNIRRKNDYSKNHKYELEYRRNYYKNNKDKWESNRILSPEQKIKKVELQRERREKDKRKPKAYKLIAKAIKNKKLIAKTKCEICRKTKCKIVSHHSDYNKPLQVKWICESCHATIHGIERRVVPQNE